MRTVAIIQARMGSTRLPGKVLLPLADTTALGAMVRRLGRASSIEATVIATSTSPADDVLERAGRVLGLAVYRGSHEDVLDRFSEAAHAAGASAVVRLTADCPLIDPLVVDQLVEKFSASRKDGSPFDYVSNTIERTYPRGLDAEVFSLEALTAAAQNARKPYEREHVTPYLYGRPEEFSIGQVVTSMDAAHHRWTLDTSADYQFLRAVFHLLGPTWPTATWEEILEAVEAHPGLADINRHIVQKVFHG